MSTYVSIISKAPEGSVSKTKAWAKPKFHQDNNTRGWISCDVVPYSLPHSFTTFYQMRLTLTYAFVSQVQLHHVIRKVLNVMCGFSDLYISFALILVLLMFYPIICHSCLCILDINMLMICMLKNKIQFVRWASESKEYESTRRGKIMVTLFDWQDVRWPEVRTGGFHGWVTKVKVQSQRFRRFELI